ncbi:MAG: sigma 54-interacting transcriptional regulator [Spirochaetales bacterium]|nr:sigma 54-interacting transcriptional regulator [Spirochaetales bacterium]
MPKQSGLSTKSPSIKQAACIILSFIFAFMMAAMVPFDEGWGDFMQRLRYRLFGTQDISPHLVHAVINDISVETLDLDSQNKNIYARVLAILNNAGIKDTGCDVFFTEKALSLDEPMLPVKISINDNVHFPVIITPNTSLSMGTAGDEKWDSFLWHPKIINHGSPLQAGHVLYPADSLFPVTSGLGHINCQVDPDGTIRRLPLLYQYKEGYIPALSLEILCSFLDIHPDRIEVSFGSYLLIPGTEKNQPVRIPIDDHGMMRLSYAGPWKDSFIHFPLHRLLEAEDDRNAQVRLYDDLSGALAFLSDSSTRRKDYGRVPLESTYPLSGIHLNALNTMLTGTFPVTTPLPEFLIIIFIIIFALWLVTRIFDTYIPDLLAGAGLGLLCIVYFFIRFLTAHVLPLPTVPLSGILFSLITLGVYYYVRNRRFVAVLKEKATSAHSLELLNRELEDSNNSYVHLQRNITRLLRSITKSLDIPLSRLHGVLSEFQLHENRIPVEILKEINTAGETIRGLSSLIRELSELTDIKQNFDLLTFSEIELTGCVKGIVQRLAPLAESRGCTLLFNNSVSSFTVTANQRMLEKILFLLITSVLKIASPGSHVSVSFSFTESTYAIRIEIHGETDSGLTPLFSGAEKNRKQAAGGGSLLHEYIALYNGRTSIESETAGLKIVNVIFPVRLPVPAGENWAEPENSETQIPTTSVNEPSFPEKQAALLFPRETVVIIDHDEAALRGYREALDASGITNTLFLKQGSDLLATVQSKKVSVILLDLALQDIPGLALLTELREEYPEIPVIVISEIDAVETAVECMKQGAFDYAVKPVAVPGLYSLIRRAVERTEIELEAKRLREGGRSVLQHPEAFASIITVDPVMLDVFRTMEAFGPGSDPVLILGESGTGKELFADALHLLSGRNGALVKENIGALDAGVFSDTLFGHTKGAYTGALNARKGLVEEAFGGTLFLDEIGELDSEMQVKLLRFIESGEYRPVGSDRPHVSDARIIAATNADIDVLVKAGKFRRDLYYRLSHVIRIPPLRKRMGDIALLAEYFLEKAAEKLQTKVIHISKRLIQDMKHYPFPGNVRELESLIFAAAKLSGKGKEAETYIRQYLKVHGQKDLPQQQSVSVSPSFSTLAETEERLIREAMLRTGNNQRAAARLLGISPFALNRRLQRKRKD